MHNLGIRMASGDYIFILIKYRSDREAERNYRSRSPVDPVAGCNELGGERDYAEGERERRLHGDKSLGRNYGSERFGRGFKRPKRSDVGSRHYPKKLPTPDYVVNPSKWTKYELSNDGSEALKRSGMTDDQVNKFAAFQFLKELRERKNREAMEAEEAVSVSEGGERKVVFKNPGKRKLKEAGETPGSRKSAGNSRTGGMLSGAGVGAGVVKMPEYVVGGEVGGATERRRRGPGGRKQLHVLGGESREERTKSVGTSSVSLSHLADVEEEDVE